MVMDEKVYRHRKGRLVLVSLAAASVIRTKLKGVVVTLPITLIAENALATQGGRVALR
jgi:hypothetical protein